MGMKKHLAKRFEKKICPAKGGFLSHLINAACKQYYSTEMMMMMMLTAGVYQTNTC
jgi:hypothetical protein